MSQSNGGRRVTLQDIARRTGYSITAVSRALRGMSDIGPDATERIKQVAQEMGYVANQTAVALRYGRTHIITLILVNITNPFFSIMTDLIQIAAQKAGYSLMILCSRDDPELELQQVDQAIARCVDGVLIFPTRQSGPAIERLRSAHMPFVLLSNCLAPDTADSVVCNDEAGAYLATRHLIEAGRSKLAYLASSDIALSHAPRMEGFLRACREAGLPQGAYLHLTVPSLSRPSPWRSELEGELRKLKSNGFDGLFLYCDIEAWRVMSVLAQCEVLHPEDFGIVSFDNIDGALASPTPLCSVDCGLAEMAGRSVELLLSRLEGAQHPPQTITCPVSIVCRMSCAGTPRP